MLVWGAPAALGLGDNTEPVVLPQRQRHVGDRRVKQVATGDSHTLMLMEDGAVLSCGSNERGQLGRDKTTPHSVPGIISALDTISVTHVVCGHAHSLALANQGEVYGWGSNSFGQLGVGDRAGSSRSAPKHIKSLGHVVQIACGAYHNLALLISGKVYSWGFNKSGQLAHSEIASSSEPREIIVLSGLPVVQIAAGGGHSLALSVSGAVYGWGRNCAGQLGIGTEEDVREPTELTTLRNHRVSFLQCGEDHSVALTHEGGVFTFGSGEHGQLGHNSTQSCSYPKQVLELMGSMVSQIACGSHHTLALLKSSGRVFSCGRGTSGQLGSGGMAIATVPNPVRANWTTAESLSREDEAMQVEGSSVDERFVVRRLFAGGQHSFASITASSEEMLTTLAVADCRHANRSNLPLFLSYESVKENLDTILVTKTTIDVLRKFVIVFSHSACLNGSFLASDHHRSDENYSGVNVEEASKAFSLIKSRLTSADRETLADNILSYTYLPFPPFSLECARHYFLVPSFSMTEPVNLEVTAHFSNLFVQMTLQTKILLGNWLFNGPREYLYLWLNTFKAEITKILLKTKTRGDQLRKEVDKQSIDEMTQPKLQHTQLEIDLIRGGLHLLKCIYDWNSQHKEVLDYHEFHIQEVGVVVDLVQDYFHWIHNESKLVVFCHYPFVLNAEAKARLMYVESQYQQQKAIVDAQRENMASFLSAHGITDWMPFAFELIINRNRLILDTIQQLLPASMDNRNLKKPLRVRFVGEEGLDDGGIRKEFFMLLLREILNPDFGMFVEDDESHYIWFRDKAKQYDVPLDNDNFVLIGMLCGLAIYNTVIIDLPFPCALYKKLLKRPVGLADLKPLFPVLGQSLQDVLDYEGDDFQETFDLQFEVLRYNFGEVETVELTPRGSQIPVTIDTRQEYVNLYVKYKLTDSVKESFEAFTSGFIRVCGGDVLKMFHPEELRMLVVGNVVEDWNELEKCVTYKNDYTAEDRSIKLFWKVFYRLPTEAKKKFLVFLTGCDRVPVAGLKSMDITIQRMDGGPNCERLPVAHTCYNVLDLPPYTSQEQLEQKLLQAINFTSGFGIV